MTTATPPSPAPSSVAASFPLAFTGSAGEFFRIWIVNLALTVLSLGLYGPWAKVRTRKWFYGSCSLDGSSFHYDADPARILAGRLIVLGLLFAFGLAQELLPLLSFALSLAWLAVLPWLIVRSLAFHRRCSSWRGVHFGFRASWAEAALTYLLLPLSVVFTLGLSLPWLAGRQHEFMVRGSRYGTERFRFEWRMSRYYRVHLTALGAWIAASLAGVALLGSAGALGALGGWASELETAQSAPPWSPLAAVIVVFASAWAAGFAVLRAGITNLLYDQASLAGIRFRSEVKAGRLLSLYLTSTLAVVASLGLAVPWAMVRMARYRAACLRVISDTPLDQFAQAQEEALGGELASEAADFFDFDFGL
jgi:uncharacterized membrane protein YjgN (DUF898 family)